MPGKLGRRAVLIWIASTVAIALVAGVALWYAGLIAQIYYRLGGQEFVFVLDEPPPFLTEALAVDRAREAIRLAGYDVAQLGPAAMTSSKTPDGKEEDVYLHLDDPNRGQLVDRKSVV